MMFGGVSGDVNQFQHQISELHFHGMSWISFDGIIHLMTCFFVQKKHFAPLGIARIVEFIMVIAGVLLFPGY